jgi:hypothetical protein
MKVIRPATIGDSGAFTRATHGMYVNKDGILVQVNPNIPRFSYDPTDLSKPPIFLLEKEATNLYRRSHYLDPAAWVNNNVIVGATDLIAPDGFPTGRAISNTPNVYSYFQQQVLFESGVRYTWSVFIKPMTGLCVPVLEYIFNGTQYAYWSFDVIAGIATGTNLGNPTWKIEKFGANGWYRCQLSITAEENSRTGAFYINAIGSTPEVGTFGVWGIQLEKGEAATSYIQTVDTPVTRSADAATGGYISLLTEDEYLPYSGTTMYAAGDQVVQGHVIWESNVGRRTGKITVSTGSPCVVTWVGHGLAVDDNFLIESGAVPAPLQLNTRYYVNSILTANTFTLKETPTGGVINATGATTQPFAISSPNYQVSPGPTSPHWFEVGSTNKFAMFDKSIESQTAAFDHICAGIRTPHNTFADTVVIKNISNATKVRVALVTLSEGIVYDKTVDLISTEGITDPYLYSFEPIVRDTDAVFYGLPPYADAYVSVTMVGKGELVGCGLCVIGQSRDFGPTQAGMSLGMQDYSIKEKNEYGNTKIQERPYADTMTLTCFVDRVKMNSLLNFLKANRATPTVYVGDETLTSSVQYGFFRDFSMGADYPAHSVLHIEIESLT